MALLIDSDIVTAQDLLAIDAEVLDVASSLDLVLTGDRSILRESWNECSDAILNAMQAFGGDIIAWPGTLTTYGAFGISRPRLRLNQIVTATPYNYRHPPIYRWMTYAALTNFYRAASNRVDKDRYETKWERFEKETKRYWKNLAATGFPMVALPLAAPGATHEFNAGGPFGASNVAGTGAGSGDPGGVYDVCITWVDQSNYVSPRLAANAESAASQKVSAIIAAGQFLQVNINNLNPPSQQFAMLQHGIADGPYVTRNASGWNVYVSPANQNNFALQNPAPIPIATKSYTLTEVPAAVNWAFMSAETAIGAPLLPGQFPDANYTFQRILQRG